VLFLVCLLVRWLRPSSQAKPTRLFRFTGLFYWKVTENLNKHSLRLLASGMSIGICSSSSCIVQNILLKTQKVDILRLILVLASYWPCDLDKKTVSQLSPDHPRNAASSASMLKYYSRRWKLQNQ
jgi:hypothetical protein